MDVDRILPSEERVQAVERRLARQEYRTGEDHKSGVVYGVSASDRTTSPRIDARRVVKLRIWRAVGVDSELRLWPRPGNDTTSPRITASVRVVDLDLHRS